MAQLLAALAAVGNCDALDDGTLSAAFVLLVCARFGLRIGEVVGLTDADWVEVGGRGLEIERRLQLEFDATVGLPHASVR